MSNIPNNPAVVIVDDEDPSPSTLTVGRMRAPFTQVPQWVYLNVSPVAVALYVVLAGHVNQRRGDSIVWPGMDALAKLLRYKRAQSLEPYLKELQEVGAIDITRRRYANGMRARNLYTIHFEPPEDFAGQQTLDDFYAAEENKTPGRDVQRPPVARTRPQPHPVHAPSVEELDESQLDEQELEKGTTTGARGRARADTVTITADAFPLTEEMRARVAQHLGGLHLSARDVDRQHAAWVQRHAGKAYPAEQADELWWGWMCRAWRRCNGPQDMPVTDADRAYAAKHWPDINLDEENARFVTLAMERDWRFTKDGWNRAWQQHMQDAQENAW